jgi:hypothetical protein
LQECMHAVASPLAPQCAEQHLQAASASCKRPHRTLAAMQLPSPFVSDSGALAGCSCLACLSAHSTADLSLRDTSASSYGVNRVVQHFPVMHALVCVGVDWVWAEDLSSQFVAMLLRLLGTVPLSCLWGS